MCTFNLYKCKTSPCNHTWAEIRTPCRLHAGFSTCTRFRSRSKHFDWPTGSTFREGYIENCPWHSLKGNYDMNVIRMVDTKMRWWPPCGLLGGAPREKEDGVWRFLVCKVM